MAFDFLNYIVEQIQHNTRLFVENSKEHRKYIISHIAALQLIQLNELGSEKSYQLIQQTDSSPQFPELNSAQLTNYAQQLQVSAKHIEYAYTQISDTLLTELKQLNNSAQLGAFGIQELISGQKPWIQNTVDDWFWDDLKQPQHKITKTNKNNASDFNQIMKDFNQIILKTDQSSVNTPNPIISDLESNTIQSNKITVVLQPIIAFLIILFLYNIIL